MSRTLGKDANATLGANLRAARERAKRDQGDAAVEAGLGTTRRTAQNLLSAWELGKQSPNANGLLRLAILYKCPLDDFFGGVNPDYDDIIEARLPLNVKQLYAAKHATMRRLAIKAFDALTSAEGTAQGESARAEDPKTKPGKSAPARPRRKHRRRR